MSEVLRFFNIFRVERDGNTLIVVPQEESLAFRDSALRKELNALHDLLTKPQIENLIIDLGHSSSCGATLMGAIITLGVTVRDSGGKGVLCNASEEMYDALRIMRATSLLHYYKTREEALKAFEG